MPKICNKIGCSQYVFAKGFCKSHQYLRTDKKPKPIKPVSDKRKQQNAEYQKVRLQFLNKHQFCEYPGCQKAATEVHHKNKRNGDRLNDPTFFMAVCRTHHNVIHANPVESRENGWLI